MSESAGEAARREFCDLDPYGADASKLGSKKELLIRIRRGVVEQVPDEEAEIIRSMRHAKPKRRRR